MELESHFVFYSFDLYYDVKVAKINGPYAGAINRCFAFIGSLQQTLITSIIRYVLL